jgi:hypothetical protein
MTPQMFLTTRSDASRPIPLYVALAPLKYALDDGYNRLAISHECKIGVSDVYKH